MSELPHILIVEDSEDDYEATIRSFEKNHVANPVTRCSNGQNAIDFLKKTGAYEGRPDIKRPDLILLDLNMPGMDGRQALEVMKQDERLKKIPVVVLTTSNDINDVEKCYESGASTYIQKPVEFDGLVKVVGTIKEYWLGIAILPMSGD